MPTNSMLNEVWQTLEIKYNNLKRTKTYDNERQILYIKNQVRHTKTRKSDFRWRENYDLIEWKILWQQKKTEDKKTEEPIPLID